MVVFAAPSASAAKSSVTGTIDLATQGDIYYGQTVSFNTSVQGRLAPKGYTYIRVVCWTDPQNVVYQWSSVDLDFAFPLSDQPGQGLVWNSEPATCIADLVYRIDGQRNITIESLDSVYFSVK